MIKTNKKTIPVKDGRGSPLKYPFPKMKVTDSFTVKSENYSALVAARKWALRNNPNWKFSGSLSEGELTVWRVK